LLCILSCSAYTQDYDALGVLAWKLYSYDTQHFKYRPLPRNADWTQHSPSQVCVTCFNDLAKALQANLSAPQSFTPGGEVCAPIRDLGANFPGAILDVCEPCFVPLRAFCNNYTIIGTATVPCTVRLGLSGSHLEDCGVGFPKWVVDNVTGVATGTMALWSGFTSYSASLLDLESQPERFRNQQFVDTMSKCVTTGQLCFAISFISAALQAPILLLTFRFRIDGMKDRRWAKLALVFMLFTAAALTIFSADTFNVDCFQRVAAIFSAYEETDEAFVTERQSLPGMYFAPIAGGMMAVMAVFHLFVPVPEVYTALATSFAASES